MVFWKFIQALFAFDLNWFVGLIANNLFFIFAFLCVAHILYEKKLVFYFFVITGLVWITGDFSKLFGWSAPFVPVAFIVGRLIVRSFSSNPFVANNMTLAMTIMYYFTFSFVNAIIFKNEFVMPWNDFPLLIILTFLATFSIHFIDVKTSDEIGVLNRCEIKRG